MIVELMGLLYQRQKDFPAETAAQRRAWIRSLYLEASPVANKMQYLDQTQAQIDTSVLAAADSVAWANDVDALVKTGAALLAAVDAAHLNCPDAARKGRWTVAQVRGLFGLS